MNIAGRERSHLLLWGFCLEISPEVEMRSESKAIGEADKSFCIQSDQTTLIFDVKCFFFPSQCLKEVEGDSVLHDGLQIRSHPLQWRSN